MRREYINYIKNLPLEISLITMENYPIHWHDSIEILFVLKGELQMVVETEKYRISENEIDIINCDEAHSISSIGKSTKMLIIHIDPNFFEKLFSNIRDIFFYTDSSFSGSQKDENYHTLRKLLSILSYEIIRKHDSYKDYIEEHLVELLYHLINNFHQLIFEKNDLKENKEQFERYDRILRYIYRNYNNQISLQDIAEKEFLSSNYLSHGIKNNMGYSLHDFINLTRVEESIKLLLETDKTISNISEELGFSHMRYFNKYFKKYYNYTPLQYRRKFKVDDDTFKKLKIYSIIDLTQSLNYISCYLEDYDRFNYDNKIVKIHIDASVTGELLENKFNQIINGGNACRLLGEFEKVYLSKLQKDISFKSIVLVGLFSKDMSIFSNEGQLYNWYYIRKLIDFLLSINLKPIIVLDGSINKDYIINLLESFTKYFREVYGDYELEKWEFYIDISLNSATLGKVTSIISCYFDIFYGEIDAHCNDYIYDTCYMLPYIIQNSLNNKNLCFRIFDNINDKTIFNNELIIGDYALINQIGLCKPSYYAYYLMSMLGSYVIEKGDGYIITKEDDNLKILLYSFGENFDKLLTFDNISKGRIIKRASERHFSINLINLYEDYEIIKYEINESTGSFYDYWVSLGKPAMLSNKELELFKVACNPKISFNFAKKSIVFNIVTKVQGYGAVLIILNKARKYLK